jgi:protein-S-isoprenylcysteine O-methyltransferase Ste14
MRRMAWAIKNFSAFMQIINAGGVFLVNIVFIGVFFILYKLTPVNLWSSFTIYGFIIGAGLAIFLKGISIGGINIIAA